MFIAFIMRIHPVLTGNLVPGDYLPFEPDVLYHLRQVEIMVHHFPEYPWFDPMTNFPTGTIINWGPVFSTFGAIASLLTGASDQRTIMSTISWLPPLLFCLVIPVIYGIGRVIRGRMCGILAAICFSVMPGMIFYRSFFGFFDHHIGEVLATSGFFLCYLIALKNSENPGNDLLTIGIPSCIAGMCFTVAVLIIPVVSLYAMITLIFSLIFILYSLKLNDTKKISNLVIINTVVFTPVVIALFANGIHSSELNLNGYSILQPALYLGICMVSPAGYLFQRYFRHFSSIRLMMGIAGIIAIFSLVCVIFPRIISTSVYHLRQLMMVSDLQTTVSESGPWHIGAAVSTYQGGLLLVLAGMLFLIISLRRTFHASEFFLFLSACILTVVTIQHWRFEYYLGPVWAVLMAIPLSYAITTLHSVTASDGRVCRKKKVGDKKIQELIAKLHHGVFSHPVQVIVILLGGLFLIGSLSADLSWHGEPLNSDWEEVLIWMAENTPDPGYDPYAIYNANDFSPSLQSYGIMSVWDVGHAITTIAGRIPYANPFQEGAFISAMVLCNTDEESASSILSSTKGRYVITDTRMISSVFPNIEIWNPFKNEILYHFDSRSSGISTLIAPAYYLSLAPRLHIYDGSMAEPDMVILVTYNPDLHQSEEKKILGSQMSLNLEPFQEALNDVNESKNSGKACVIGQSDISQPTVPISALRHFRLLYESQTKTNSGIHVNGTPVREFSFVKIFEVVPGAHIPGEGTVSLTLRTNTGREFHYQQKSINGSFVLPYPTDRCSGEVCPVGLYNVLGTNQTIKVSESEIRGDS